MPNVPGDQPARASADSAAPAPSARSEFQRRLDALDALVIDLDRRLTRLEQTIGRDFSTGK